MGGGGGKKGKSESSSCAADSAVVIYLLVSRVKRGNAVLLMGLSGSGKTALWSKLIAGEAAETTVTSADANRETYFAGKKVFELVDVPGFPRIRYQHFETLKNEVRAILFVVDSSTIQKDLRDAAEFLYVVLTEELARFWTIGILCNKQDQPLSKSTNFVRGALEKELTTLRMTRSSQLDSQSGTSRKSYHLGKKNKHFEFGDLPQEPAFLAGSVSDSKLVENWINSL